MIEEVTFKGQQIELPFLTKDDCKDYLKEVVGILEGIHVPSLEAGFCFHLYESFMNGIGSESDQTAAGIIHEMLCNVWQVGGLQVGGWWFGYMDINVHRQLNSLGLYNRKREGTNQPGTFSHEVRSFWLKEQLSRLK